MTVFPVTNLKRVFVTENKEECDLNITVRHMDSLEPKYYTELIVRTVKLWLYIAKAIEKNLRKLPDEVAFKSVESSVEELITKDDPATAYEFKRWDETRVTVFDWNHKFDLTIHSSSLPQSALDIWWAMTDAQDELAKLYPSALNKTPKTPNVTQDAQQQSQQQFNNLPSANAPQTPTAPVTGAIVATRAPNPNNQDYPDGQLVEFKINKIVLGTHPSGSVIYSLWGDLGKRYALKTIYVMASNGTDKSYDYQTAAPVLDTLALSIPGKVQAEGNWKLICKATNSGAKQYMNIVSLTAV